MPRNLTLFTTVFALVSAASPALASIQLQGMLVDAENNPVALGNQPSLVVELFAGAATELPLWEESHTDYALDAGVFTLALGSKTLFPEGFFASNPEPWVGVTLVFEDELVELPRVPLSAVARAYYADHATTCDALTGQVTPQSIGFTHGDLPGLADDDHPQYLLVSGARPMAGHLDLAGHQLLGAAIQNAASAPAMLSSGQLWWDTTQKRLMVSDGAAWVPVASDDFPYAASTSKGGPAIDLACSGCIEPGELAPAVDARYVQDGLGEIDSAADFGFAAPTHVAQLDADLLDGKDASDFALANHSHAYAGASTPGGAATNAERLGGKLPSEYAAANHTHGTSYVGQAEPLRILRGRVKSWEGVLDGEGFGCGGTAELAFLPCGGGGTFTIVFDQPFSAPPTVTATPENGGTLSAFHANILTVTTTEAVIQTWVWNGAQWPVAGATLSFIAIGPQ